MKRTQIPKQIRFEVFKRDAFTCQYCGSKSPDVILHVDHIKPVSKGGDNQIINLITACHPCNSGKSDIEINDDAAIKKQRAQLEELNERREQLEMMMQWRETLRGLRDDYMFALCKEINELGKFEVNENGKRDISKWLLSFSFDELINAATVSFPQYIRFTEKGKVETGSWERAFSMIPRIAKIKRDGGLSDEMREIFYIRGILRRRFEGFNERGLVTSLKQAVEFGVDLNATKELAKYCHSARAFMREVDDFLDGGENGKD